MSITAEERNAADYYAGPNKSFPINKNGEHLKAAWHLANTGHGDNPDRIKRNIKNYASRNNLTHLIPEAFGKKSGDDEVKKARSVVAQALMEHAYNNASDDTSRDSVIDIAHDNDIVHMLPGSAHGRLHQIGVHHAHEGMEPDHEHEITKAYNPISGAFLLTKAWGEGSVCHIEGWLSTPTLDPQKHIIEPDAFAGSMGSYFARRAPISYDHGRDHLPAGHLQKAAIVHDGRITQMAAHPTDGDVEFEAFPARGSGLYVRGVLTEEAPALAVRKGNVGGFSFIGNGRKYTLLPENGKRFTEIDPWIESTIAPYPINKDAVILVAKAYGLEESEQES